MFPKLYSRWVIVLLLSLFGSMQVRASNGLIDIQGTVLDQEDQPMEGVSIIIKGTHRATITDAHGLFRFSQVNDQDTLTSTMEKSVSRIWWNV